MTKSETTKFLLPSATLLIHGTIAGILALGIQLWLDYSQLISWLTALNIWLFLLMGIDKSAARLGSKRVSERTLLWLAFLGGSPGLFLGRTIFGHKTSKQSFINAMWLVFAVQVAIIAWYFSGADLSNIGLQQK